MFRKYLLLLNLFIFSLLLNFQFFRFNHVFQLFAIWLLTLIPLYNGKFIENLGKNKRILIYSTIWFVPLILSLFYSQDIEEGLNAIQKSLFLIVFPIIFLTLERTVLEKLLKVTSIIFPISTILFVLFIFIKLNIYWYQPYIVQYGEPNILEYINFVYNHRFSYLLESSDVEVVSQFAHKTYIGVFILFSVVLLQLWRKSYFRFILQCLLFVFLILLKGKTQILLGSLIFIYLTYQLFNKKVIILFATIFITAFFIYSKSGITKIFDYNNSLSFRIHVTHCTKKTVFIDPIFGVGIGDVQKTLDLCYEEENCIECKSLNTHNYYLYIFACSGIIGLIIFLFCYYQIFKIAFLGSNEFLIILIIIFASLLTENLFSRMWGCIAYGLFANLMLSHKINLKQ